LSIKIVIADDHPIFLAGLKEIISYDNDLKIIDTASDGEKAIKIIKKEMPDVAVLDFDMPEKNAIQVLRKFDTENCKTKFIILTMHKAEDIYNAVIDEGASGYILKENSVEDLVEGIKNVYQGHVYISPTIHHFRDNRKRFKKQHEFDAISDAEWRVLVKTAEGLSNQQIAEKIFLSVKTIESHRSSIIFKLGLEGKNSLLKFALSNKEAILKEDKIRA
jgi:DNA-binding NarL/FixJ family response regulator